MSKIEKTVQARLFELQDQTYRDFQCKLMPTVNPETVIGVRTPELRKLAMEISKAPEAAEFLKILPHKYYEENNLHRHLIEPSKTTIGRLRQSTPFCLMSITGRPVT